MRHEPNQIHQTLAIAYINHDWHQQSFPWVRLQSLLSRLSVPFSLSLTKSLSLSLTHYISLSLTISLSLSLSLSHSLYLSLAHYLSLSLFRSKRENWNWINRNGYELWLWHTISQLKQFLLIDMRKNLHFWHDFHYQINVYFKDSSYKSNIIKYCDLLYVNYKDK
jgi:hypothetical protein